tara:strand:+ start:1497 stop:1850 length:354 start_codon:yes stop_codon:yes gene_type:complete
MTFQPRGRATVPMIIQARSTESDTSTGQPIETWVDEPGKLWVSVETRGGTPKGEFDDALIGTERKVAVFDYRKGVAWSVKNHRLKAYENDQLYQIIEISDLSLKHHRTELTLEELVT